MQNIKLFQYKCGKHAFIADFDEEALKALFCLKALNDEIISSQAMPLDNTFFFLTYTVDGEPLITVDCTLMEGAEPFSFFKALEDLKKRIVDPAIPLTLMAIQIHNGENEWSAIAPTFHHVQRNHAGRYGKFLANSTQKPIRLSFPYNKTDDVSRFSGAYIYPDKEQTI